MSIYNIIAVTSVGIVTGLFNMLLSKCGYVSPSLVNGETVAAVQSVATKNAITFSFVGLESITAIILIVILAFINVEKHKKTILFHTRCGRNQEKRLTQSAPHLRNEACNRGASRGRNGKSINTEAGSRPTWTHNFGDNRNVLCQTKHGYANGRYKRI